MARLPRPVTIATRSRPAATASSTTYWIMGLSTRGSISFGCAFVAGRNRVPRPAAGNTALRTIMASSYLAPPSALAPSSARAAPPDALEHGDEGEDAPSLEEDEHRLVRRGVLQQDRGQAQRRGDEVDEQDALRLRQAELGEAVVHLVAARVREPVVQRVHLARHDPRDSHERDIEERDAHDQQGRE